MISTRVYTRQDQLRVVHRGNPDEGSEDNLVLHAAAEAFCQAAEETMNIIGYNVIAENGWVVKKFKDGKTEKIKKIDSASIKTETGEQ